MQHKILWSLVLLLAGTYHYTTAQQPAFPRPNAASLIPFGQKQLIPAMKDPRKQDLRQLLSPGADHFKQPQGASRQPKEGGTVMSKEPGIFLVNHMMNRNAAITKAAKKSKGKGSNFQLTGDINPIAESDPGNITNYLSPLDWVYPVVNNVAYFEGDDGVNGRELLRSDGTAAGTYAVKDINPGEASTLIYNMTAINNQVYFAASTNGYSFNAWVTDGTAAGTQQIDINTGSFSYSPHQFIQVGSFIYIIQDGYGYRSALWQTDGTAGGTFYMLDLATE